MLVLLFHECCNFTIVKLTLLLHLPLVATPVTISLLENRINAI